MRDLCRLIGWTVIDLLRSRARLEAEIWALGQQINVLRRAAPKKLSFNAIDRLLFVGLYRLFPRICDALAILKPDTIVRWHYYNEMRTHLSPDKDSPVPRAIGTVGHILCRPVLGGLHHHYVRI
jgi:hypothetical protein